MQKNTGYFKFIAIRSIVFVAVNLILANIITLLIQDPEIFHVDWLEKHSKSYQIFLVVFLAPLVESIIFQLLPISFILLFPFKYNKLTAILLSAFLFSLNHQYNYYYMIVMFILGILFAYFFIEGKERFKLGFLTILIVHMISNAVSYI